MTDLPDLQRLFAACLDGVADTGQATAFYGLVAAGGELTAEARAAVYRGSSREARLNTLEVVYPVCRSILGERCFRGLASAYLDETPSMRGDLNLYGDAFPALLQRQVQAVDALAGYHYFPDLARLEWHWHAVYYAPADPPFDMHAFARASAGEGARTIRFRLAIDLRLLASCYPVYEIWRRHREGEGTGPVPLGEGARLVIRRDGYAPLAETVASGLFDLLAAIAGGHSLGELANGGLDLEPLPGLIASGWIAGFAVARD